MYLDGDEFQAERFFKKRKISIDLITDVLVYKKSSSRYKKTVVKLIYLNELGYQKNLKFVVASEGRENSEVQMDIKKLINNS